MAPCFGGPSLNAHQKAAGCQGIDCRVIELPRIAFDLDSVEDVQQFAAQATVTQTAHVLREFGVFAKITS
jgi:2-phospho-L-lactate guanylyltransferase (CobY/MobA/RfbA family)